MNLGAMEIIVLMLALGPGGGSVFQADALALVSSQGYLQHRGVQATPEKQLEILKKTPTDPKSDVLQLIAIRWLGENKAKLGGQESAVRTALGVLTKGPPGFAQDYAKVALAKLDDKPAAPLHFMPKGSVRGQALEWFPDEVTIFGAAELRAPAGAGAPHPDIVKAHEELRAAVMTRLPQGFAQPVYQFVDTVGNVRIDRVAMGYAPVPAKDGPGRIYVRLTGRGDVKRIADFIQANLKTIRTEERKGPRGEAIRLLIADGRHEPSFGFIGDHDLIIAGPMGGGEAATGTQVLEKVLSVLHGKQPGVTKGPFAQSLQASLEDARALILGALPEEMQMGLASTPLGIAPASVAIDLSDSKDATTEIRLRASFEKPEDAKKFADNSKQLLAHAKAALKQLPFMVKPETIEALQKTLDSIEVTAAGPGCTAILRLTPQALKALSNLFEEGMKHMR